METQLPEKEEKRQFSSVNKKKFWLVVGAFLVLFGLLAALIAFEVFNVWRGQKGVEALYEGLKQKQEELYQRQLADTYGGTTPQETLRLYIEAVEKGDYELASRYFVKDKQKIALIDLQNSSDAKINTYISLLKDSSNITGGYYSRDYMPGGLEFIADDPIYIRMIIYPNNVWKIIEI